MQKMTVKNFENYFLEAFSKRFTLAKVPSTLFKLRRTSKAGDNFNRRNTRSISRIEI
jgi:hypothetical protein